MKYVKYPENRPTESGYYMCFYFNEPENNHFFKALWYGVAKQEFIFRIKDVDKHVKFVLLESRNDYYIPCNYWCDEHTNEIEPLTKDMINEV